MLFQIVLKILQQYLYPKEVSLLDFCSLMFTNLKYFAQLQTTFLEQLL